MKGGGVNSDVATSTANDGSYSWTIPVAQTPGTDYQIRIESTSNAAIYDWSNGNFAITPPTSITVTSPNGGESWAPTSIHTIVWSSTGSPGANVKIELLKGGAVNRVIATSTANNGSYSWTIPAAQTPGTDYKIRITSTTTSVTDSSDGNFAIPAPFTITSPNGGESWVLGSTHTITWTSPLNQMALVKISLYKGGVFITEIASTANDGSYSWTISGALSLGTDYKIKIESNTTPEAYDWSDGYFTIREEPV
jgi:hypothetical protein